MSSSATSNRTEPLNVIFVHGWGCGWQDWSDVSSLLPERVRVGLAKLPGSPDAISLDGAITLSDCAAHVVAHADELGFDRFALVGHSMGARIAIELAANWQERVSDVLLVDGSNVPEDPDEAVARLAEQLAKQGQQEWAITAIESMMVGNLEPDQTRDMVNRGAQYSSDVLIAYYHAMAAWDRDKFLAAIDRLSCPVTIMQSTSLDEHEVRQAVTDHSSSLWLDALRARLSQAVITLVPNTGHFIMLEQPQLIAGWVEDTLQADHDNHQEKSSEVFNQQLNKGRSDMKKEVKKLSLVASIVASSLAISAPAFAEGEVVFASWGGSFQDALRSAMLAPAASGLSITVKEDTTNGIQDVRAQITAGAVAWDVTEQDLPSCETLSREGSLEPIDYSIVDTTGIPKELIHDNYIGFINFTKVIAYRKDVFGDNGPSNWAEFWDLEKFPGKRGMHGKVNYNLEAALMADGVPMAEVYDTLATDDGMKRAWSKLEEIAPEVTVWYRGGSQSAQLLRDGEVDVIHMGHNRVESVIDSGIEVAYAFDGGTMDIDCLLVPKGAPNVENAMRLINELLGAEAQARLAVTMPLGPVNTGAFDTGIIEGDKALLVNTHPANYDKQLLVDPNFYIGQLGELTEEFDTLIQQ